MAEFQNFSIPWLAPTARARIVLFHHAGGSALSLLRLGKELSGAAELLFAEMPGHGARNREPFVASLHSFARECARELHGANDPRPLIFYGHSMGALLAYETAVLLSQAGRAPREWVVSACAPPSAQHGPRDFPLVQGVDLANDEVLLRIQRSYGAFGPELGSPLLKAFFLPILRSDIGLIASYRPSGGIVPAPLTAIAGGSDPVVSAADLEGWKIYTDAVFQQRTLPGGHFFPLENKAGFVEIAAFFRERLASI
jgi:surfactin synthase thioesterase subunit